MYFFNILSFYKYLQSQSHFQSTLSTLSISIKSNFKILSCATQGILSYSVLYHSRDTETHIKLAHVLFIKSNPPWVPCATSYTSSYKSLFHSIDKQHCQNLRVISNQSTFLVTLGTLPYYIVFHSKLNETHINLCTFSPSLPCHTQSCGHSYISCHNRFFPAWPIIIISTDSCYVHQELPSLLRYYSLQTMHV